jgi:hypothetical protein
MPLTTYTAGQVLTANSLNDNFGTTVALVKTQTIGTTVSTVTVTDAFSATYDAYKITLIGGTCSSSNQFINLQLGSTATGYFTGAAGVTYAGVATTNSQNNLTLFSLGITNTNGNNLNVDIFAPHLAARTYIGYVNVSDANARTGGGYQNSNTVFTDFTITPAAGTLTGGEIRVYGYANS